MKNKKGKSWYVLKSSVDQTVSNDDQLLEVEEQISIGKCIKLYFHVQRFSMNCFCVSFNSLSGNV